MAAQQITKAERTFIMNKVISMTDGQQRSRVLQLAVALTEDAPTDVKEDTFYAALSYYVDNPRKVKTDYPRYVAGAPADYVVEGIPPKKQRRP